MKRRKISLEAIKLPTMSAADRRKSSAANATAISKIYYFDPVALFLTVLSSPDFLMKSYRGMAEFVNLPSELWQSRSWGSSIRSCSGDYAHYHNDQPLFPSDTVYYRCRDVVCDYSIGFKPLHIR